MKLAVIGTGYVGLVSGAVFSDFGHEVMCVDIDVARVAMLKRGELPIHEPGLAEIVRRNANRGRLRFTTSVPEAVSGARIVILAVATPSNEDGSADLQYLFGAAVAVASALDGPTTVVTKSTVPVGTAAKLRELIAATARHPFSVASNPEFLKEGAAVDDFINPARVIVGVDEPHTAETLRELYGGVLSDRDLIQVMDTRSAELTKYAANAMLATRISFMNELARFAEVVGADIDAVRKGIGTDPRIGPEFLFAGAGFGGSCFPKDLRALAHSARDVDVELGVVDAVARANARQKRVLGERLLAYFGGDIAGKRIAIWGLAFKPETDDIRESPALTLIEQLRGGGAQIAAFDPAAMPNVRAQLGDAIELAEDPYTAAAHADALVLVTEWRELRAPNFTKLRSIMRTPILFDGRNVWSGTDARAAGFVLQAIGRR